MHIALRGGPITTGKPAAPVTLDHGLALSCRDETFAPAHVEDERSTRQDTRQHAIAEKFRHHIGRHRPRVVKPCRTPAVADEAVTVADEAVEIDRDIDVWPFVAHRRRVTEREPLAANLNDCVDPHLRRRAGIDLLA